MPHKKRVAALGLGWDRGLRSKPNTTFHWTYKVGCSGLCALSAPPFPSPSCPCTTQHAQGRQSTYLPTQTELSFAQSMHLWYVWYLLLYNLALVACILHTLAAEYWNWHWRKMLVTSTDTRPNFTSQMEGGPALKPSLFPSSKTIQIGYEWPLWRALDGWMYYVYRCR